MDGPASTLKPRTGLSPGASETPGSDEFLKIDAYWRAANYLSVGQIYLYDNPLLREPLTLAHMTMRGGFRGTSARFGLIGVFSAMAARTAKCPIRSVPEPNG